ncbi:Mesocentin [Pseudocercospora fuligena]|uniref:Mesocentin n=1 Tax=Pseudocercospora fuligena TaxID=685502 RepID=A0A8H6RL74_9PEZI|nr:Mesocentin [Pseudocercospora fuligena]
MAPSPAAGKQTGVPKTPTKLTRKPGQTPQRPGQTSASKPAPSTPKAAQAAKPETDSPKLPPRPDVGGKAEEAAGEAEGAADDVQSKAGQAQSSAGDDDEDDGPLSKVTQAGQKGQEGLQQQAPEPVQDDDDDDEDEEEADTTTGAQQQTKDFPSDAGDEAEDVADDATEKAGDTVQSADDDESSQQGQEQQQPQGKKGNGLLSGAKGLAGKAQGLAGKASQDPKAAAQQAGDDAKEGVEDTAQGAQDTAEEGLEEGQKVAGETTDEAGDGEDEGVADTVKGAADSAQETAEGAKDQAGEAVDGAKETAEDAQDQAGEAVNGVKDQAEDTVNGVKDDLPVPEGLPVDLSVLKGLEVDEEGMAYDKEGNPIGRLAEGDAEDLAGYPIGDDGEILDDDGDLVGRVELLPDEIKRQLQQAQEDGEELPEDAQTYLGQLEDQADDAVDGVEEEVDDAAANLPSTSILEGLTCQIDGLIYDADGNTIGRVIDGDPQELQNATLNDQGEFIDQDGNVVGHAEIHEDAEELVQQGIYEPAQQAQQVAEDAQEQVDGVEDGAQDVAGQAEEATGEIEDQLPGIEALQGKELNEAGEIIDEEGNVLGNVADEDLKKKIEEGEIQPDTLKVDEEGNLVDGEGNILGKTELAEGAAEKLAGLTKLLDMRILDGKRINKKGKILDDDGEEIGELTDGELSDCAGARANDKGEVFNKKGELVGHVRVVPGEAAENATRELLEELGELEDEAEEQVEDAEDQAEEAAEPLMEEPELDILDGLKVNKKGKVLNEDGEEIGELTAGDLSKCAGKKINAVGEVIDKDGNVIGHVRTLPQEVQQQTETPAVSVLEGLKVNKKGQVLNEDGEPIGELTSGDLAQVAGKKIDAKGQVLDDQGNVLGTVRTLLTGDQEEQQEEEQQEEEPAQEEEEGDQLPPLSILEGLKVNKSGKLIDDNGAVVGELVEGDAKKLSKSGVTCDAEGQFWDNKGHVIGRAQTLPQEEPEEEAPFAGLDGLRVVEEGWVQDENGDTVGYVTEGEASKLIGRVVDEDGDIIDKKGSVVGHAERYVPEEQEEVQEEAPDLSFLEGKTVTKAGLVIGDEGIPVARLVEGNVKELTGKPLDKEGQFWNDKGAVIGKVELIPESEREAKPEGPFAGLDDLRVIEGGKVADEDGNVVGEIVEGNPKRLVGLSVDEDGDIVDKYGNVKGHAEPLPEEEPLDYTILDGLTLNKSGFVVDENGIPFGKIVEGSPSDLAGKQCDENGYIYNDKGKVIGRCEPLPEDERQKRAEGPFAGLEGLHVVEGGYVQDEEENTVGQITEGDAKKLVGMKVDEDGDILDKFGNVKGHAERLPEEGEVDYSILDGLTLNKQGFAVDSNGTPFGRLVEGNASELAGRQCDEQGYLYNDRGKAVGRCEPIPENERVARPEGPFAGLEGLHVVKDGKVEDENGNIVGEITEGDAKRLVGMKVDEDGDIIDKFGNTKGHAEPLVEEEEQPIDNSALEGKYLNKQGYVVDDKGIPFGRLVEGNVSELAGRKCDENGFIYGDTGKVVGKCEILPENERVARPEGPFAGLEGLRVVKDGFVEDQDGNRVGQIVEGEPKRLVGLHVDEDGDIIDKYGNVKGHAEPWTEEEAEEKDLSILANTTINKSGYAVDGSGQIIGQVVEGDIATLVGKKVDGKGQIWDNSGNVIGKADTVTGVNAEEGPFAGFDGLQINKDGTVTTPAGDIIGRVVEGDIKKLLGHTVDEDGDILDKNGNKIGKAERWEPEEKERRVNPMSGKRVNKDGEVRDENGDLMGKLTMGDLGHCVGQEIDDAGNVVDVEGNKIGEVTLIENIAEDEYEGPTEEELEEARKREEERQIAEKMCGITQQTLERMQPICKQIKEYMEKADNTPKDELDEEELVNNVKPLIEEGGRILQECNGSLRGLDPDGKIAAQAKGRAGTGEATPEEFRLAETLKELTTTVVTTIDDAKKKLNNMPHAKKKLNPLWSLMTQPLFQILAAVGLLLAGVLGLVGQLLNGLGLGGLVNGLLGGLGINKLLASFGLIDEDKNKKKKGGGNKLSSLPIVGGLLGKKSEEQQKVEELVKKKEVEQAKDQIETAAAIDSLNRLGAPPAVVVVES